MVACVLSTLLILASPITYDSEATYNKTDSASRKVNRGSQTSRKAKRKKSRVNPRRTAKRRRGNIKRRSKVRHNRRYMLKRRPKAGGTITGRQNSRATNSNRKRTTNRVRKNQHIHQHPPKKRVSSKRKRSARSPVHLSPLQKQMLMLQMEVLLSDPEMGPIYRQIINNSKKTR